MTTVDIAYAVVALLSLSYAVRTEIIQLKSRMKEGKCAEYFSSPLNLVDLFTLLSTLIIIALTLGDQELSDKMIRILRTLAAVTICLLSTKLYDWLRLFDSTAFYI